MTESLLLVQKPEPSIQQFAVQLQQFQKFDVYIFVDDCAGINAIFRAQFIGNILFSTLILAVSNFPFSSSRAISRLATFACAPFFSCRVRSRCTANLQAGWIRVGRMPRRRVSVPQLHLHKDYLTNFSSGDHNHMPWLSLEPKGPSLASISAICRL